MGKTITTAVFDGRVLHPESTIDLEANRRYIVTDRTGPARAC